ncbi:AraC family transcriptional regulator [Granulicella sp. L60]|uniref:AraC family transcriptional regulator n=1 Tax=Granulicella sp. L60 TaxID=1641866 RepID=UPI00131BFC13|nr:AraC family transcriptional regulator [Granulicella sp. L60]
MSGASQHDVLQAKVQSEEFGQSYTSSQWRELLSAKYGLDSTFRSKDRFRGVRADWRIGDLCAIKARVSEQTLILDRRRLMPQWQDSILIKLLLDGQAELQGPRDSVTLGPGDMLVLDPSSSSFKETIKETIKDAKFAVLILPKSALRSRGIKCDLHTWIKPNLYLPNLSMIRDQLLWAIRASREIDQDLSYRVSNQIVDMMDIVLDSRGGGNRCRGGDLTLSRVKGIIKSRLSEAGMDAASIASATRLSISYLNHLFRSDEESMMNYLWTLRLEKSARLLASPRAAAMQIEEIAWQCGFSSAAHFSRRFRDRYGTTPGGYRQRSRELQSQNRGNLSGRHRGQHFGNMPLS